MNKKHFFLGIMFAAFLGGLVALLGFHYFMGDSKTDGTNHAFNRPVRFSNYLNDSSFTVPQGINFIYAAEVTTPGVVHIRSTYDTEAYQGRGNPFEDFFRDFFDERRGQGEQYQRQRPQSAGSGVIISADGYILTNNHVVDNAEEVEVTLNDNRRYEAEVIGTDPSTDLALLKIDEEDLHFLEFGDSDALKIGEWVLAVGNPFDLTSTVTAGIVSAKARNINILRDRNNLQIESFIQTDAAVNPGNSGGALVDLKGRLVGINTAIATPTGSYAGYSFAVPAAIARKVAADLREYGTVQRALLGIRIQDVTANLAEEEGLDEIAGVYVAEVNTGSAADEAGIENGDVIVAIGDVAVNSTAELQEQVARNRPGDKVKVTFKRNGEKKIVSATLKNTSGSTEIVRRESVINMEGADFQKVDKEELEKLSLEGGVKITDIGSGKWKEAGIRKGFIITSIDKQKVDDVTDISRILRNKEGGTLIEGVYPDGEEAYYAIGW